MTKISDMTLEQLQERKNVIEEHLKSLREDYKKLSNRLSKAVSEEKHINELIDEKTLVENDIPKLLEAFPETSFKRKALDDFLRKYDLMSGGFWVDTNQTVVRIYLHRNKDNRLKKVYEGLKLIIPHLRPLPNGNKPIDIFEHSLSYSYSYTLQISDKNEYLVCQGRYSKEEIIYNSSDLMETLNYIQRYHWYDE